MDIDDRRDKACIWRAQHITIHSIFLDTKDKFKCLQANGTLGGNKLAAQAAGAETLPDEASRIG